MMSTHVVASAEYSNETTRVSIEPDDVSKSVSSAMEEKSVRIRRQNTTEEKKKMKRERRAKKRQLRRFGAAQVIQQLRSDHDKAKKQLCFNQKLAQLYWDRWRHEVQERKSRRVPTIRVSLPQIAKSALVPNDCEGSVVGRGSFGIVRHMTYRGIDVAVKTFDSDQSTESILCEASFLSKLNHPNLPLFFGCCTTDQLPYIVMQFYGIDGKSVTMHKELASPCHIATIEEWLVLCYQLADTIRYLHNEAHCLHNDIKTNNVLLTNNQITICTGKLSIVLIDFNKATRTSGGKQYSLSPTEKTLHYQHYPHLAPEVIGGTSKQTCASDIFAAGKLFEKIAKRMDHIAIGELSSELHTTAAQCSSENFKARPSAVFLADSFKQLLRKYQIL